MVLIKPMLLQEACELPPKTCEDIQHEGGGVGNMRQSRLHSHRLEMRMTCEYVQDEGGVGGVFLGVLDVRVDHCCRIQWSLHM